MKRTTTQDCDIDDCGGHYVVEEGNAATTEKWCDNCYFVPTEEFFHEPPLDPFYAFLEWRASNSEGRTRPPGGYPEAY